MDCVNYQYPLGRKEYASSSFSSQTPFISRSLPSPSPSFSSLSPLVQHDKADITFSRINNSLNSMAWFNVPLRAYIALHFSFLVSKTECATWLY